MKDIHANPQFRRENMRSLDGEWEFEILDTPFADNLTERTLTGKIRVPFCPESELSGVGCKGEIRYCAYAKTFSLSAEEKKEKVLLRFGACDYEAHVYLNGVRAGSHRGGYSSFCFDVSALIREGENRLFVLVYDDPKDDCPSGKQTFKESSFGCFYSRVTGIWQSVWLEFVPECYLTSVRFIPDIRNCRVRVRAESFGSEKFGMQVFYGGRKVGECAFPLTQYGEGVCGLSEKHLWEVGEGRLYDVVLTYGKDVVHSYFGLRECAFSGEKFLLNGKSVFQRLVLDQGYHPKGLYTVPTEEEMRDEIGMATALGFNGARLHQKVFEPQFLYECDKAGYLVWEELPSWGIDYTDLSGIGGVLEEWREIVGRDVNHPCIVTWCPANEFWTDEFRGNKYPRVCDLRYVKPKYKELARQLGMDYERLFGPDTELGRWLAMRNNPTAMEGPGAGTMKAMMLISPLMSLWIAFQVPAGVGIYWIVSNVLMFVQTMILNKFYNPKEMAEKAKQEAEARREQERMERIEAKKKARDGDAEAKAKAKTQKEINRQKLAEARKRDAEKYGDVYTEVTDDDLE